MKPIKKILAIETSCDETAASVIDSTGKELVILSNIVSSQIDLHKLTGGVVPEVAARAHLEAIVPVIREALIDARKFENSGIKNSLKIENCKIENLFSDIDAIAVTCGPGLIGALLIGFNTAKTLAYALNIPLIPINHIEGHIYSALESAPYKYTNSCTKLQNYESETPSSGVGSDSREVGVNPDNQKLITDNEKPSREVGPDSSGVGFSPKFPLLALTVSGGHTSLTLMRDHGVYETIGETVDDAAGEAFDKVAKLLGLGYPGGPAVSKLAEQFRNGAESERSIKSKVRETRNGQRITEKPSREVGPDSSGVGFSGSDAIRFPRPMLHSGDFNFSFSGLKTAVLHKVRELSANGRPITDNDGKPSREVGPDSSGVGFSLTDNDKAELCAAFEDAVVDVLITKTLKAAKELGVTNIIVAGGVSANRHLRDEFNHRINNRVTTESTTVPTPEGRDSVPLTESQSVGELTVSFPPSEMTGDNAAMIGLAAAYHILNNTTIEQCNNVTTWDNVSVNSNLRL